MKRFTTHAVSWALGLAVSGATPASTKAQGPVVAGQSHGHGGGLFFHRPVFPRTYSYVYPSRFNTPVHRKYVGPDGRTYWRTTVRGLPLGTPWPSY
jgi:hypothetical protein